MSYGILLRAHDIDRVSRRAIDAIWFLDRRERENPWLLAAAFLWGGCIATALSLPFNMAFFRLVDRWVALNPLVAEILGPNAAMLIAAPLSAPIIEELTKAAGVGLIFWLLRDEFDNMRDGFVYGRAGGSPASIGSRLPCMLQRVMPSGALRPTTCIWACAMRCSDWAGTAPFSPACLDFSLD